MIFPSKPLVEITKPKQWKNLPISKLKNSGYPVYGANGIIGYYDAYNHEYPTIAITCRGATCGNIHITEPKSYITSNAMALDNLDVHICDLNYLAQYLRFRGLEDVTTGAAQPQITRTNLERVKVPLPHIDDQIRIATLLSRVEALISTRKNNLQQLDDFLKSTFLEMFGDPVRNEKGWATQKCSKAVTKIVSGTSYGGEGRNTLKDDEMGVLKISSVTEGHFNPNEIKAVNINNIKKKILTVCKGDFLVSRANTKALVAACCIVDKDYPRLFLPDKLWKLAFDENNLNPQFFNYLLKNESFRNKVRKLASGGHQSMLNISMKKFLTLDVIVPEIDVQNRFSEIILKTESLKNILKISLVDLENLYGTLSQKAFKGKLDLSRITLPEAEPKVHSVTLTDQITVTDNVSQLVEYPMSDPIEREKLLRNLFDLFLIEHKNKKLSLDDFWQHANFKTLDSMDEFDKPWNVDDYEQLKGWLFELIKEGKLEQSFSEDTKQIELTVKG